MKYWKIFLLYFQIAFEMRGRSFVWFLYSVIPISIFLLFWQGAVNSQGGEISGWTLSTITSYYFLLLIASSMLISHIEDDVANEDIQQGKLSMYLLRPISYFISTLFLEIPWRILQGSFGIIITLAFVLFFGSFFAISHNPIVIVFSIIIAMLAFIMSFIFKTILGFTAFWLTDSRGLFQVTEALLVVFGGFVVPITLLPSLAEKIALIFPFAYMVYYPIIAFQGQLELSGLIRIISIQILWIIVLTVIQRIMWNFGRKRFTGVGQ